MSVLANPQSKFHNSTKAKHHGRIDVSTSGPPERARDVEVLDGAPEGSGARESGLDTLVTNLVIAESQHEAIEEQWLWPAVRNALDDGDELADQAIAQEQAGKVLLQRLEDGSPGDPDYHDALREFVKAGREHIAYEQDVARPRLAATLTRVEPDDSARDWKRGESRPNPPTSSDSADWNCAKDNGPRGRGRRPRAGRHHGARRADPPDPQIH